MTIFLEIVNAYVLERLRSYKQKSEQKDSSTLVRVANFGMQIFGSRPMRDTDVASQKRNYVEETIKTLTSFIGCASDEETKEYIAKTLETLRTETHARAMEKDIQSEGSLGTVVATSKTTIEKIYEVFKDFGLLNIDVVENHALTPLYILQKQIAVYLAKKEIKKLDVTGMALYKERRQLLKQCLHECRNLENMHAQAMQSGKDGYNAETWEKTHRKAIADKIELLIKHNHDLTAMKKMVDPSIPVPGLSLLSVNLDLRKIGPGEGSLKKLLEKALEEIAPGAMSSSSSSDDRSMLIQFREKIHPPSMSSSPT